FAPSEPDVIGHRPVLADVVVAAKVTVLFAFSCSLALAQNVLPTIAIVLHASWWAAVVHVAVVCVVVALITVAVTVVYGIAARLVPRDRFDDVAAWSQTGLAIVFVALAIVTPRSALRGGTIHVAPEWFLLALAPAWFAGLEAWIATGTRDVLHLAVAGG